METRDEVLAGLLDAPVGLQLLQRLPRVLAEHAVVRPLVVAELAELLQEIAVARPLAMMAEAQERIARRLAPAADREADFGAALRKDVVLRHPPPAPDEGEVAPRRPEVCAEQEERV